MRREKDEREKKGEVGDKRVWGERRKRVREE